MKKLILAILTLLPIAAMAQGNTNTDIDSIAKSATIYDHYMSLPGSIITCLEYGMPEFKSTVGEGLNKVSYKADVAIVSFNVNDETKYFLRMSYKRWNGAQITRYIPYENLVELRNAFDNLEQNLTRHPIGDAVVAEAAYSIKAINCEIGYKITSQEKKGERTDTIYWYLNPESRESIYALKANDAETFKEFLGQAIAMIKRHM